MRRTQAERSASTQKLLLDATIECLRELRTFHYVERPSGTTVDWKATYTNFDALCEFIERFSEGWRTYFFVIGNHTEARTLD